MYLQYPSAIRNGYQIIKEILNKIKKAKNLYCEIILNNSP